jgi:hypothetical protein
MTEPERLAGPDLSTQERTAYAINYWPRLKKLVQARREPIDPSLKEAMARAGSELRQYLMSRDNYRITFRVEGREHVTSVDAGGPNPPTSGVCLEGDDRKFDLSSLVGVLREKQEGGELFFTASGFSR